MGVVSSHPTDKTMCLYGLGELDDISSRSVIKHLEVCATCQRRLAKLSSDRFRERSRGSHGQPDQPAPGSARRSTSTTHRRPAAFGIATSDGYRAAGACRSSRLRDRP